METCPRRCEQKRNGGELETHRRDHRSRYRVACSGHGQKPHANGRARCHGEPLVTITPRPSLVDQYYRRVKLQMKQHEVTVPQIGLIAGNPGNARRGDRVVAF
jgi:hypothetical protein